MKRGPKITHLLIIALSSISAWVLAITASNLNRLELGAIFNFYFPPMLGVASLIFYTAICFTSTDRIPRNIILTICCLANLYLGVVFHFSLSLFPFN